MISSTRFVKQSLETHLFFARIMKEHSFFLEVGFAPKDSEFIGQADSFRQEFDGLLAEVITLSNGVVSPEVLQSGEVITEYTLDAEMASAYFTGIKIQTDLTKAEAGLMGEGEVVVNQMLEQRVFMLNQRATALITALLQFKSTILSSVLSCKMFTMNYPLLIDHIIREALLYLHVIQLLQSREEIYVERENFEQEVFWNKIMEEHSKFIRGLLDPSEEELIVAANDFGNEFEILTNRAKQAMDRTIATGDVTNDSLNETKNIRDFKAQGTKGILECKVKSIIIPLLGDHVLREANHYLRLLEIFEG